MGERVLPEGWVETTLGEVLAKNSNNKGVDQGWSPQCESYPSRDESEWGVLKTTAIQDGYFLQGQNKKLPDSLAPDSQLEVKAGDLLMTCAGPRSRCGVVTLVRSTRPRLILSGKMYRFRAEPQLADSNFLEKQLRSPEMKVAIDKIKTGGSDSGLNLTHSRFNSLKVVLPPLSEQRRIADKLDTLLGRLDACREHLDRVPALLKRFRQSVLAAATSGRLTEDWREANGVSGEWETDSGPWRIPTTWSWSRAEDVCEFITKGTTPPKEKMSSIGEVPFIKVYNLTFEGQLDFSVEPTFVSEETHRTDLRRSIVRPGDVLMNIVGPPLGKVSIVPDTFPEWNMNQAMARFRALPTALPSYLALCLQNQQLIDWSIAKSKATAGQFNLTLETCRDLPVPVPGIEEQYEIVRRVQRLISVAATIEDKYNGANGRVLGLDSAMLTKAFRGDLAVSTVRQTSSRMATLPLLS